MFGKYAPGILNLEIRGEVGDQLHALASLVPTTNMDPGASMHVMIM